MTAIFNTIVTIALLIVFLSLAGNALETIGEHQRCKAAITRCNY